MPKIFPVSGGKPDVPVGPWPIDPIVASVALAGYELLGNAPARVRVQGGLEVALAAEARVAPAGEMEISAQEIAAQGQPGLRELGLTGSAPAGVAPSLPATEVAGSTPTGVVPSLPRAEVRGAAEASVEPAGALEMIAQASPVGVQPALPSAELAGGTATSAEATMTSLGLNAQADAQAVIGPSALELGVQVVPVAVAPALPAAEMRSALDAKTGVALPVAELAGQAAAVSTVEMRPPEMLGSIEPRISPTLPAAEMHARLAPAAATSLPQVGLNGESVAKTSVGKNFVATTLASKDVWVDNLSVCVPDTNRDGSNLQIDSTPGAVKDAYIAFDLSVLPSDATVTEARVIMYATDSRDGTQSVRVFKIADADEGWSESAIRCSSKLSPDGGSLNTFSVPSASGEFTSFSLSGVKDRAQARIGVGMMTLILQMATTAESRTFQSKDSGGTPGNASGPRLLLTFTTP